MAGALILVVNVENDPAVVDRSNIRIIDARKGIVAFGKLLLGPGAGNHLAAKYDRDPVCPVMGGKAQAVKQIGTCVCDGQIDWLLRACDNDRTAVILDQIGQGRSGISHGISAMADYKAIVEFIFFFQ